VAACPWLLLLGNIHKCCLRLVFGYESSRYALSIPRNSVSRTHIL